MRAKFGPEPAEFAPSWSTRAGLTETKPGVAHRRLLNPGPTLAESEGSTEPVEIAPHVLSNPTPELGRHWGPGVGIAQLRSNPGQLWPNSGKLCRLGQLRDEVAKTRAAEAKGLADVNLSTERRGRLRIRPEEAQHALRVGAVDPLDDVLPKRVTQLPHLWAVGAPGRSLCFCWRAKSTIHRCQPTEAGAGRRSDCSRQRRRRRCFISGASPERDERTTKSAARRTRTKPQQSNKYHAAIAGDVGPEILHTSAQRHNDGSEIVAWSEKRGVATTSFGVSAQSPGWWSGAGKWSAR